MGSVVKGMTNPGFPPPLSKARHDRETDRVIDLRRSVDEFLEEVDEALETAQASAGGRKRAAGGRAGNAGGRDRRNASDEEARTPVAV